ncbi:hypothetical protein C7974DRAFT_26813 [Boeremia exigua]|uniref:uncharacterized protein n=1 Tax=Boeremia exigua TaxID=749465 RepID=UPI001E8E3880|nr:uncharacterized protein C7974DRAFT_26813 [Boeremia exigua]KAH6644723.1 hypothetical protein C7974DRAFT_26813 [Boeremia exigua]
MRQPKSALYGHSSYSSMMELPFRSASNNPSTPDSSQQSFDGNPYFNTVPEEILNFPVTRVANDTLDPWLMMDMPDSTSPESSRMSMSPSQGIATPSSDGFYSPPYPEQLQLPAYQLLEQPRPLRCRSTSHPNWVNNGGIWAHQFAESELWDTQPFATQSWIPSPYDDYASPSMAPDLAHTSNIALLPHPYSPHSNYPMSETIQTMMIADNGVSPSDARRNGREDSSDEDSDTDEEGSNYSQSSKMKTESPRPHIDKWTVSVGNIQHSVTRGYVCAEPGCKGSFVRPEHLRRHFRSKHSPERQFKCKVPECKTSEFSRGDNLRDHYWTHLHRGGRKGKNRKYSLEELKEILGPKEKKLIRRLRDKLRQHHEKEKLKKQQSPWPTYVERSML